MSDGACVAAEPREAVVSAIASESPPGVAVAVLNLAILTIDGSCIRGVTLFDLGIPVTILAGAAAWLVAAQARSGLGARTRWLGSLDLTAVLLSVTAGIGVLSPSPRATPAWYLALYRMHPAIGIVTVGMAAADNPVWRRRAVLLTTATAMVVYFLAPVAVPKPHIDLWSWIQACGSSLMAGVHPYTVVAPDLYRGAYDFGSTPTVFPYMPALLLFVAPAIALVGDYRFAIAACLPLVVALLEATARRVRLDDRLAALLTLAIVLHPRGALMTMQGFGEPLLMVAVAAFAYCSATGRDTAAAIAYLLLPALKQYVLAPALLFIATWRRRAVVAGLAVAAATVVPFLIWNFTATLKGMFFFVWWPLGFRTDSDSAVALMARVTGYQPSRWLGIAAQFVAAGVAQWLLRGTGGGGLLLMTALALLTCFLLATQAFLNYYALVAVMFVFSAALLGGKEPLACA